MQKEFVTYDIAFELKKLGFNEPCLAYWNGAKEPYRLGGDSTLPISKITTYKNTNDEGVKWGIQVSAPLYQQVIDWFFNNHNILIKSHWVPYATPKLFWIVQTYPTRLKETCVDSKEEAILKTIELCKIT